MRVCHLGSQKGGLDGAEDLGALFLGKREHASFAPSRLAAHARSLEKLTLLNKGGQLPLSDIQLFLHN